MRIRNRISVRKISTGGKLPPRNKAHIYNAFKFKVFIVFENLIDHSGGFL